MSDITLTIPLELTAAQIIRLRAEPTLVDEAHEATARELAIELHRLLAAVQAHEASRPLRIASIPFTAVDLVDAMRRHALGLLPMNPDAAAQEADWIFEMLDDHDGGLGDRYLRLCKRIDPRVVPITDWDERSELH
jgi:hypothetical protein